MPYPIDNCQWCGKHLSYVVKTISDGKGNISLYCSAVCQDMAFSNRDTSVTVNWFSEGYARQYLQGKTPSIPQEKSGVTCPKCGSEQLTAKKKGFSLGKAVAGTFLLGPIGAAGGLLGSNKTLVVCLRCGSEWEAGYQ